MAKELPQITFEFSGTDAPREFLSGQPIQPAVPPKSKRGRKSLKEMDGDLVEPVVLPDDEVLFKKAYYGITEVAEMLKIPSAQLRQWDKDFDVLQPRKNRRGDRHFRPQDLKNIQLIHDLIRRRKFTVEGAKEYLRKNSKATEIHDLIASLQKVRAFLVELRASI